MIVSNLILKPLTPIIVVKALNKDLVTLSIACS